MKHHLLLILCACFLSTSAFGQSAFPGERGATLDTSTREDIWDREAKTFLDEFVRVERDESALSHHRLAETKWTIKHFDYKEQFEQ